MLFFLRGLPGSCACFTDTERRYMRNCSITVRRGQPWTDSGEVPPKHRGPIVKKAAKRSTDSRGVKRSVQLGSIEVDSGQVL